MIQIDLVSAFMLIGISQGAFISAILLLRADNHRSANRFLGLCAVSLTLFIVDEWLIVSGTYSRIPAVALTLWPTVFLIGPTFWWYVRELLEPAFHFGRKQWPHLLPMALSTVLMVPFYVLPAADKIPYLVDWSLEGLWQRRLVQIVEQLMLVHMGGYFLYTLYRIRQWRQQRHNIYSYDERTLLDWIYGLSILFVAGWLMYSLIVTFFEIGVASWTISSVVLIAFIVLAMFGVVYLAMRYPQLLNEHSAAEPIVAPNPVLVEENRVVVTTLTVEETTTRKYAASSLGYEQANYIEKKLLMLMETEQPYLIQKLTLSQLAEKLDVSPNHLSQVLNEHLASSFFDFVNRYRIEDAKRRLLADRKRRVIDIALDAGFSSKSGFYKAFRQSTGMTPSQFRKSAENTP